VPSVDMQQRRRAMRTAGAASATAVLVAGLMAALPCTADPETESAEPVVCFLEVDFDDRATWASQGSSLHPTDLDVIRLLEPYEADRVTRARVAHLLLDPGPTPRDALARELLAFVLNVRHRLVSTRAYVELPDRTLVSVHAVIDTCLEAWAEGSDAQRTALTSALAELNGSDRVRVSGAMGCAQAP
jgi:hypothetical protein